MIRTFALGTFVALVAAVTSAAPQSAAPAAAPAPASVALLPSAGDVMEALEALPPQGFTYNAEGRRDPFVVLLKRGSDAAATTAAARAAGLAGLSTGEVTLRGVLLSEGSYVGMLLGSDDKTYIVRPGDRLADGTITAITGDALVVLQQVNDPLAAQTAREVRKALRRTDDTN